MIKIECSLPLVEHLAQTVGQFGPYEGDLSGNLFSGKRNTNSAVESSFLPDRTDVHDWVDHCLFGRALTWAGDSVYSYSLSMRKVTVRDIADFVLSNSDNFCKWKDACSVFGKNLPLNGYIDFSSKPEYCLFAEVTPRDFQVLIDVYDAQEKAIKRFDLANSEIRDGRCNPYENERAEAIAEANDYFTMIGENLCKRSLGECIFVAELELAMLPWVKSTVESCICGEPPPTYQKI
jgi:hypothetical protein